MKKINPLDPFTEAYLLLTISNWFEAIDVFLQWKEKLNMAINGYDLNEVNSMHGGFSGHYKWSQTDLIRLHLELVDGLRDLSEQTNFVDDGINSITKIQELNSHTETIRSWSKKIQLVLEPSSFGTA